jgi:hypothetical protein
MHPRRTSGATAVAIVGIVVSMTGCGTAAPDGETAVRSSAGASEVLPEHAPPADPLDATTAIRVGVDELVLVSADGTALASFDYYDDDAAPVAAALTIAFGEAPTVEEHPGGQEQVPTTRHGWEAFTLIEQDYRDEAQRSGFVPTRAPSFVVEFDGTRSNGVELASADGMTVGQTWDAIGSSPTFQLASECAHAYTESEELEVIWYDGTSKTERLVVDLVPNEDATRLAEVRAPVVESGCV